MRRTKAKEEGDQIKATAWRSRCGWKNLRKLRAFFLEPPDIAGGRAFQECEGGPGRRFPRVGTIQVQDLRSFDHVVEEDMTTFGWVDHAGRLVEWEVAP